MAEGNKEFTKFFQSLTKGGGAPIGALKEPGMKFLSNLGKYLTGRLEGTSLAKIREDIESLPEVMYRPGIEERPELALDLAGMGIVGGAPGMPKAVPGTVDVGMLKPMAFAKLLKEAASSATFSMSGKKVYSGLDLPQAQHLVDLLKVPTKEFKGLKDIAWSWALKDKMAGQFGIRSKKMFLNPTHFGKATARHEFVHKRQWLPKAKDDEVMLSNYIRALRGALFKNRSHRYGIDPVEVQAYAVEDLLRKGRGWSSAFKETLNAQRIYEPAEQVLGSEATALLQEVVYGAGNKYLSEFKLLEEFSK